MLSAVDQPAQTDRPYALIVPHAGYRFSGPVAASAYRYLRAWAGSTRGLALFGPSHFVPLDGAAVSEAAVWQTPIGNVEVDEALRRHALAAGAALDEAPHAHEHALEVQLPWLQIALGPTTSMVPVAVGKCSPGSAAALIGTVGDVADLVVVSTDLSHYLPADDARRRDRRTADAVLAGDAATIGSEDACGMFALRGLVELTRQRGGVTSLLDLRTSGDTAGDPDEVVGYGAFAITIRG